MPRKRFRGILLHISPGFVYTRRYWGERMRIAVIGEGKGKAARYLQELAAQQGICLEQVPLEKGGVYDVVLAGPMAAKAEVPDCRTYALVAYGKDAARLSHCLQAQTVITYGTEKSTLSLSSTEGGGMVSQQREIMDISGSAQPIGEIRLPEGLPSQWVCGAAGALLACGWKGM